jgi:Animal haem peroxidase
LNTPASSADGWPGASGGAEHAPIRGLPRPRPLARAGSGGRRHHRRGAVGHQPKTSFTAITGESTDILGAGLTINDPSILDFIQLRDQAGKLIDPTSPGAQENAVTGIRRTTLASRLRAIYGSVDKIDAFVGIVSEKHVPGTEFGELQLAIWKDQFQKLRDGDKYFYLNDKALPEIMSTYGVNYKHSLADIIRLNTGATVQSDVFHAAP